jgi:hypothetical protein
MKMPMNIDRKLNLLATENGSRPGDFPVGSAQSRAAARHLLKKRMEGRRRRETIIGIDADRKPSAGEYGNEHRGSGEVARFIGIPCGMTLAEGLRAVGGFTEEELSEAKMQTVVHSAEIWSFVH